MIKSVVTWLRARLPELSWSKLKVFDRAFENADPRAHKRPASNEWSMQAHVGAHLAEQSSGSVW